jgi:transposase-like protein
LYIPEKMTCPSSLHFSPVVYLVHPGETHWRCNYCEYTFKSKLYVPAKGHAHLSADAAFAKEWQIMRVVMRKSELLLCIQYNTVA